MILFYIEDSLTHPLINVNKITQQKKVVLSPSEIYNLNNHWTQMNTDFVVMVRQTHHERHCILSLWRELSRTIIRILVP